MILRCPIIRLFSETGTATQHTTVATVDTNTVTTGAELCFEVER